MKKTLFTLALLTSAFASVQADEIGISVDIGRTGNGKNRELRECRISAERLRRDNNSLSNRLLSCRDGQADQIRIEQLTRENNDLVAHNRFLLDQNERLKIDIARLEIEAHPDRGGRFNLAESIRACGKINSSVYSQECAAQAKTKSISASVIEQCAKISSNFYALECVKSAGATEATARQVEACVGINSAVYAQECVQVAGEKRIHADIIRSCISTSTSTFYQLECIKNM